MSKSWPGLWIPIRHDRVEQERFYAEVNAAYTAEVCKETLQVNEEFPIHEE